MSTTESEKPSGGARPLSPITITTPQPTPHPTKVKRPGNDAVSPSNDDSDDPRDLTNHPRICAQGTFTFAENEVREVRAKIFRMNEAIPDQLPGGTTRGGFQGADWYFDDRSREIKHRDLATAGIDLQLGVWVILRNDPTPAPASVIFHTDEVGDETECS